MIGALLEPISGTEKITGVVPPMITPFDDDGQIYEHGLVNVINFLVERGVAGLFAIGSYGSFALLETSERKQLAEMILHHVEGRIPVIIQVGSPATHISVELAKHSADAGAAAVASVVPFYYSGFAYKDEDFVAHYAALCEAVDIPVYAYNNPKTTGFQMSPELIVQLAAVGVSGMKDSSGDYAYLVEVIRELDKKAPNFNVMSGSASLYQPLYYQGARGCVAGTSNAFPELLVALNQALQDGDLLQASELQSSIIALRKIQNIRGFRPASCYTLLRMRGLDVGTTRAPWVVPDSREAKAMETAITALDILPKSELVVD